MNKKYRNYEESLFESLKNHEEAVAYLNAALQDDDQRVFLLALKDVFKAQNIDISAFASESNITRQNIYRILSSKGNPRWQNLTSLLDVLGLQLHLTDRDDKFIPLAINTKLLKTLSQQATKQGISLDNLIYEKLSK